MKLLRKFAEVNELGTTAIQYGEGGTADHGGLRGGPRRSTYGRFAESFCQAPCTRTEHEHDRA